MEARLRKGPELQKWAQAGVSRGEWTEANHHELVRALTKRLVKEGAESLFEVVWDPNARRDDLRGGGCGAAEVGGRRRPGGGC